MSPAEAAQLQAGGTAAEAAANAALNLGAPGAAGAAGGAGQEGLVMHARRLSGGGAWRLPPRRQSLAKKLLCQQLIGMRCCELHVQQA
jgi:hypothetical protein